MAKPRRNAVGSGGSSARRRARAGTGPRDLATGAVRGGRVRPATRRLDEVLAERGPLTGPITDAGTRALVAVRSEAPDDKHGKR
jgi:hypothetical protein